MEQEIFQEASTPALSSRFSRRSTMATGSTRTRCGSRFTRPADSACWSPGHQLPRSVPILISLSKTIWALCVPSGTLRALHSAILKRHGGSYTPVPGSKMPDLPALILALHLPHTILGSTLCELVIGCDKGRRSAIHGFEERRSNCECAKAWQGI
ncbi:hypothetical protein DOTSEDRAFT_72391 [Dothistroma septosporum NZE10]|uniref:Uncharacterized protein n=1 Tax=Dothistroma septosporum (strain NZE10 / CBS 128990) TaxID=675120 RepID=M2XKD1_DOTSN|nr:hypothetical protein DOTSEDRAFT_72391 [Dothistroma septosporum NZE10]